MTPAAPNSVIPTTKRASLPPAVAIRTPPAIASTSRAATTAAERIARRDIIAAATAAARSAPDAVGGQAGREHAAEVRRVRRAGPGALATDTGHGERDPD